MYKQINNRFTGEVIKIEFDDKYFIFATDSDIINSDAVKITLDNIIENAYNELLVILGSDYEISTSKVNWVIRKGSTGDDTFIRVSILTELLGEIAYDSKNILANLIQSIQPLETSAVRVKGKKVQYLEELLSPAKEILFSYIGKGVKIEKLVTDEFGNESVIEVTDINELLVKRNNIDSIKLI